MAVRPDETPSDDARALFAPPEPKTPKEILAEMRAKLRVAELVNH